MSTVFEHPKPVLAPGAIGALLQRDYGLAGTTTPLDSERDQNLLVEADGRRYVLKIANAVEDRGFLSLQNAVLEHLAAVAPDLGVPRLVRTRDGAEICEWQSGPAVHAVRLLTYLPGRLLSAVPKTPELLASLGRFLGRLSRALESFGHPAAHRPGFLWNLDEALAVKPWLCDIASPDDRTLVARIFARYEERALPKLRRLRAGVLHQDANDNNLIVSEDGTAVTGLIDFGDMTFGRRINELAVALAYALLGTDDPFTTARPLTAAYAAEFPLTADEAEVLFDLAAVRLAVSVCVSSHRAKAFPENEYLLVSQAAALRLLGRLDRTEPALLAAVPDRIEAWRSSPAPPAELLARRARVLGPSLSISYRQKLKIVRGRGAWLYDHTGRPFLDCVNNICHVGHAHPRVVDAIARQAAILNTNTRYLHDGILDYAERLASTFPRPLSVVYLVCSGSEANELALRMARTVTGRRNVVTLDWAYHGNTGALIEVSPYKFNRKGGSGKPDHVEIAALPDPYRGPFKGYGHATALSYAASVAEQIEAVRRKTGQGPAAFLAEAMSGCGGQIVFPQSYLREAARLVREAGGLMIVDEVQTGFGRVGSQFWAHTLQDVVPDIVTLGKPIGNGHPMAAVITTPEIAAAFANGMEFFSSFGGNPVSAAAGMAVLDVLEDEHLQENALTTGRHLKARLEDLARRHELIGDVRGEGLFLGVELVRDRETIVPATEEAGEIINRMRDAGVLLSTDGPFDNVIKIKPPIVFGMREADLLADELEKVLDGIDRPV